MLHIILNNGIKSKEYAFMIKLILSTTIEQDNIREKHYAEVLGCITNMGFRGIKNTYDLVVFYLQKKIK